MDCELCPSLVQSRTRIVRGRGPIGADIMCIGEAPGQQEDAQGKAFCGKAGQVLACLLEQAGVDLSRVYLANSCCCRPPGNRTPTVVEIENCRQHLLEEIRIVKPKVILSLGTSALRSLWKGVPIGDVAGQTLTHPDTVIPMVATYHPAYVMRQWSVAAIVLEHIKKALRISQEGVQESSLGEYVPILTLEALELVRDYVLSLGEDDVLAADTETTGLSWMQNELLCISLSPQEGMGFVIPILKQGLKPAWSVSEMSKVIELIGDILSSPVPKAFQNASFDLRFLERQADWKCVEAQTSFGWKVENLKYDTLIISRMLCQSVPHDLDSLMAFWTDLPYYSEKVQVLSKRKSHMEEVPNDILWAYAGADADVVRRLVPQLLDQLTEGQRWLLDTIVMPVVRACWNMEQRGLLVDKKLFNALSDHYTQEIGAAENSLFKIAKGVIKYHGVPLQKFLFEQLGLPIPNERTEKANECDECRRNKEHPCIKHVSTAADTLVRLNEVHPHPALPLLLNLSKLTKFNSTYLEGYGRHIRPDNRIHAEFKVGYAATGRHSAEDPNLQNQPKDLVVEKLGLHDALRQIFIAPKGHAIMRADWSQVEVVALAYQTKDPTLLELLRTGADVHAFVARRLGGLGISKLFPNVDSDLDDYEWQKAHRDIRQRAKAFVFGLSYGLTAPGAADRLGCSIGEAELLISAYMTQVIPSLSDYFDWIREQISEHGGIPNRFGRWRYFPEAAVLQLMRQNKELDDLVRVGINFPIQSGAHDLHQAAHVSIESCPPILQRAKPILEVHDELVFEAVDQGQDYLIQTAWLIKEKCEKLARNLVLWDGSKLGWECLAEISWGPSLGGQQWKLTARGDIITLGKGGEDDNGN